MIAILILRINIICIFTLLRPLRDQELNSSFMSLVRRRYGTDLTHQSGSSVNEPAGRSEWSGISHFTRLPPVASCKPTQIGRMIREMSTMRKASCARPVHLVYQRKGRWRCVNCEVHNDVRTSPSLQLVTRSLSL